MMKIFFFFSKIGGEKYIDGHYKGWGRQLTLTRIVKCFKTLF
jgi:hypothetical protein